jgi:hypothetical protein
MFVSQTIHPCTILQDMLRDPVMLLAPTILIILLGVVMNVANMLRASAASKERD